MVHVETEADYRHFVAELPKLRQFIVDQEKLLKVEGYSPDEIKRLLAAEHTFVQMMQEEVDAYQLKEKK